MERPPARPSTRPPAGGLQREARSPPGGSRRTWPTNGRCSALLTVVQVRETLEVEGREPTGNAPEKHSAVGVTADTSFAPRILSGSSGRYPRVTTREKHD